MFSCRFQYVSADRLAMTYQGQRYLLDRKALLDPEFCELWQVPIAKRIKAGIAGNRTVMLTREEFCYVSRNRARTHF